MNQTSPTFSASRAMVGAAWMIAAGIAFSILNIVTQWLTMKLAFLSASAAFWQYAFALVFSLPFLWRAGLGAMRTRYHWRHVVRVALAAFGGNDLGRGACASTHLAGDCAGNDVSVLHHHGRTHLPW